MTPKSPPDTVLLISDLHLQTARPDLTQAFLDFLANRARDATAVYILGDLFNVWIGDDDNAPLCRTVSEALRGLADAGVFVYFLHGNRDFLLGNSFASNAGVSLLEEPHLLEHLGRTYVLMHGDVLCTRDTDYQNFRAQVRSPHWQQQFLARSLEERRAFAEQARTQSRTSSSNKAADIMDVTQAAVERVLLEQNVTAMIHGHTHRPAVHKFTCAERNCERIVIGDWDQYGWFVELNESGARQYRFDLRTGQLLS